MTYNRAFAGAERSAHSSRLRGIYVLLDPQAHERPAVLLDACLRAGVRLFQYRAKQGIDRRTLDELVGRAHEFGALVIVNDDLAAARFADGVHLGQEDLPGHDAVTVRERLGGKIFGVSCGTPAEAIAALALRPDYLGVGPFAATSSKTDAGEAIGQAGVRAVVAVSGVPVCAIGGISLDNIADVASTGAAMAAVISALATAPDPESYSRALEERWRSSQPLDRVSSCE